MKGIVIFYCALLSVIGMGEAALCRSTEKCSDHDVTLCVVNCSDVAITMFNQSASHGNCRISITSEGERVQGCYIHECNTSHPDLCVPDTALGNDAVSCCCTEDECNSNFAFPEENSTSTGDIDYVLCVHVYSVVNLLQQFRLNQLMGHTYIPHTLLMLDQVRLQLVLDGISFKPGTPGFL